MSSGIKDEDKLRLDGFDGSDPSLCYTKWRRSAELHSLGLPSTVGKEKWGARLLVEYAKGEAEEALEDLPVSKITEGDGYKDILDILDQKYKNPQLAPRLEGVLLRGNGQERGIIQKLPRQS